jgi:hypothetical protein
MWKPWKVTVLSPALALSLSLVCSPTLSSQDVEVRAGPQHWIIEAIGTESATPEVIYLLMKMEFESAQAVEAARRGERQLQEFLAAVDHLKISDLTYRVCNNVLVPGPAPRGMTSGFVYTRNVVFTLRRLQLDAQHAEVDRVIAQLEDLGARYNSHCVTCVGSG